MPMDARNKRSAQTVRKEQKETAGKISQTRRQIRANEDDTRKELRALQLLEGQIKSEQKKASVLRKRIADLTTKSKALSDSVQKKEERIDALRVSYAKALRSARRQRKQASSASFILGASSFDQARRRVRYLKELTKWERQKADGLKLAVAELAAQKARLDSTKIVLASSADSLEAVQQVLREKKNQSSAAVNSLKRQSKNLNKILSEQQALARKLDQELNRIIEEEARKAREEEERRKKEEAAKAKAQQENQQAQNPSQAQQETTPQKKTTPVPIQSNGKAAEFPKAKGRLPLPIDKSATVVSEFGRHSHSEYSSLEVQNNGIDLETSPGASAIAVHPGTVSMIIVMEGYKNVVLVRHGEYLTVYAGIDNLAVRKGQEVSAGQPLGRIFSDPGDNNRTILHFEVRHEKEKLNPASWLRGL